MNDCIFCKIILGELDSAQIWSNDEFISILDINPNTKGVALLISKKHYLSDLSDMPQDVYERFFVAARNVINILKKGLDVKRVGLVVEGMGINHAHIKLYPMHGLEKEFQEMWGEEKIFFENYEGYLTTQIGQPAKMDDLKRLAIDIKENI